MEITRQLAGRGDAAAGHMDPPDVERILFGDANPAGRLVMDDVQRLCADPLAAAQRAACNVLASWDRTSTLDAHGAPLFREFWRARAS